MSIGNSVGITAEIGAWVDRCDNNDDDGGGGICDERMVGEDETEDVSSVNSIGTDG